MTKIEVTSDAPAIAADRGYLPNVTVIMWSAVAEHAASRWWAGWAVPPRHRDGYPGDRPAHLRAEWLPAR
jgi:hypothetical protein